MAFEAYLQEHGDGYDACFEEFPDLRDEGSVAIRRRGHNRALGWMSGHVKRPEFQPLADKLDSLGQDRGAETEGALDDAGLAADVTREIEGRCLTFAESAHYLTKYLPHRFLARRGWKV